MRVSRFGPRPKPVSERFWSKVNKTESCWLWTGCLHRFGYGKMSPGNGQGPIGAHRLVWIMTYGEIPPGAHVLHKCDVPACVNPEHLFLGTQTDNMADKTKKGRTARGSMLPHAKLSEKDIPLIRERLKTETKQEIADSYGVNRSTIKAIDLGKAYAWVQ